MYPKDEQQLEKFVIGIIKSLHSDQTRPVVMQQLTNSQVPLSARIANVVSQVISTMLQRVKQQSGEKPHIQLLLKSIKMCVEEVSRMAMAAGIEVTKQDKLEAAKIAGDMIEQGQLGSQQQMQGQPQQQQQMQPQMNRQPQGQGILGRVQ